MQQNIEGTWHLVDQGADEQDIPWHRMDLVIRQHAGRYSGAILSRVDGTEMPLVNSVSLEGEILRLQMKPAPGKSQGEMPSLVMQARGQRFEGAWMLDGVALGPVMKLVRRPTA